MDPEKLNRLKRQVWYKFIVNVSLEQDPIAALKDAGYEMDIDGILYASEYYRMTGNVL